MITRIEIDGFKSFVDFELEVPPFLVVMGENAGGKSNLIDALMVLADSVRRGNDPFVARAPGDRGIPAELFHQYADGSRSRELRIAVGVEDCPSAVRGTVWRTAGYDAEAAVIDAPPVTGEFAPDGYRGAVYGMDDELHSWIGLGLVPTRMRDRGLVTDRQSLEPDGGNLAAVLGRISEAEGSAWQELLADAVALLPELRGIRVFRSREYWDLELESRGTGWMSARTASDGTLRVLAMLAAARDPRYHSVLIIDEVENGLHPARLAELVRRLRAICRASAEDGGTRQMILTTHSPVVLSSLVPEHEGEVVFLSTAYGPRTVDGRKVGSLRTVAEPVGGAGLPRAEVRRILGTVQPLEPPR